MMTSPQPSANWEISPTRRYPLLRLRWGRGLVASNLVDAAQQPYGDAHTGRSTWRGATGEGDPRILGVSAEYASKTDHWRDRYARRLWVSDLAVLTAVVFGTQIAWFGVGTRDVAIRDDSVLSLMSYWAFSTGLLLAWMWALSLADSRSDRIVGSGSSEYIRIVSVSTRLFGMIAILAFLLRVDVARGYLLISFPVGIGLLLIERWVWRRWLVAERLHGGWSANVLLVGSPASVAQIAEALQRDPGAGYRVVGACIPDGVAGRTVPGTDIPVCGDIGGVLSTLDAVDADTVAVTSTDELPPSGVKRISWALEADRRHLILAPSIADIVGPRIHTRPVAGLPLIHVETPRYSKGQRFLKRAADITVGSLGLVVLAPLMAALALTIRSTTRGPAFFSQTRIGLDGRPFRMLKFRTMVTDAEERLSGIEHLGDAGNEVLFKMIEDPRVTSIGRILRRYSLDELPQLVNVLTGSMSLVGPRPPLPREVARYADHVHRRFMVKPGITGLWQVSGRSSLSWAESVRLDLSYVDNWTLAGDIVILLRTARAALLPGRTAA
jgi:exopolysaccharide biosynthesis polyprenyl glycosylphosphotransferase